NCTENHENLCKIIDKWNQNKDNFLNEITRFDEKINDIFYDYDDLKQNINDNKKEKIRQLFICAFKRSSDRKYLINKLCNSKEKLFWFNFLYGDSSSDKNELNEDELIKYKLSMELLHNLNLLQYQRLISEYNVIPHFDDKVNSILLNIVDNWYEYFEENNANVDRNFNFNVFEMLFNIPEENFKKKHGNFALDIFKKDDDKVVIFTLINKFNKLILANQKVIIKKFLKEMMSYYNIFDTIKSKHKIYYLKKFLSKNTANISKYMLKDAIKIVIGIIEKINNDTVYDFYEVKAIEDLEDDVDTIPDKDNYSTILIHYLRDLIILHNDDDYYEDIYKYSEKFYKSDIIILNRISYYLIDKYYDNLKDIIWNSDKNPLNSKSSHEFSSILSNHKDNLKGEEINKLIGWIENINDFYKKLPSTSSSLKSIKKGWYCCLNQNNKEIKKILVNYKNVKAEDPHELNNKNQKISSSFYNELKNKTNNELIAFIEEKERSNDINCFELELVFEEIIGEKINQTVNEINNFLVLPLKYQISLFHVLLNKNIIFNEKINQFKVINYINDLLNSIQKNKDSMEEKLYYGIVGYLRRYGDNLNKKDDFFEDILIKVYGHVKQFKGDSFQECFDYCNDNFSKIYKIMIRYELKLENKEKNKIKIFLTEQLSKNEYELLYFVGYYLNNLYIQDNNWVKRNFDKIFPKKDNLWKYALRGYLESYPFKKRNNELIDYLNNKKLFNKIVNEEFRKNYYKQSVHFIFLEQDNNILDDLLENITEVESLEIIEIIHNLINKENITKYNNILIKIWGQLLIKFKENKNVFSEINIWIELINEINDDNFNLLLKSIDYLDADDYYYTRELKRLVDTSPEEVCKLLLNKKEILLHHPNELKYILDTLERKNFEKPYLLKIKRKYKRKGYIYS
ncbi:MAG: hypothetical protein Q4Q23_05585, partial [Methanobacteriaceae archaeon]|nr:hypothetical protein [Methanobacteriaceae archaeon]